MAGANTFPHVIEANGLGDLASIHVAELNFGAMCWVGAPTNEMFLLVDNASLIPDGTTIIAPVSPGAIAGKASARWVLFSGPSLVTPTTPVPLRIMLVGDSQTVGNGGALDEASAYRETFFRVLKAQRGEIRLVGNAAIGPTGRDSILSDWRMAATGGQTIQQADAQATAAEALDGTADIYVVLAGTNNIALGDSVATMLAAMRTLVANRLAANPSAIVLVMNLYPWVSPAVNFAANNATRLAFNAALPAALSTFPQRQVQVVQAGSLLSPAHMNSSGIHANYAGNGIVGTAAAEAVVRVAGPSIGASWPRDPMRRTPRAAVFIETQDQSLTIPAQAGTVTPVGAVSFSYGFQYYATNVGAVFERSLFTQSLGNPANRNIWLNSYSTTPPDSHNVQCFVGSNVLPVCEAKGILRQSTWHMFMVSADITTLLVQLWIFRAGEDGRFVNTMGAAGYATAPWNLFSANAVLGAFPGLNGMPGVYSDFWMAVGEVAQPEDAERYYNVVAPPSGVTAYYQLNEGGGVAINPTTAYPTLPVGNLVGNWVQAGTAPTPWDYGSVNDTPLAETTIVEAFWQADATLLTATTQVVPPGSGASTSTSSDAGVLVAAEGKLYVFYIEYTGNVANVGGQQLSMQLLLNGTPIATIGGLATNGGLPAQNFVYFPDVEVKPGDSLVVTATPSAPLTAAITNLKASTT